MKIPVNAFVWRVPGELQPGSLWRHNGEWWMRVESERDRGYAAGLQLTGNGAGDIQFVNNCPSALTLAPEYSWREVASNIPEDGHYHPGAIVIGSTGPILCTLPGQKQKREVFTLTGRDVTQEHGGRISNMPVVPHWYAELTHRERPDEGVATLFSVNAAPPMAMPTSFPTDY